VLESTSRLLAKSVSDAATPRPEATLPGHTSRVVAAGRAVLSSVGDQALRSVGLDVDVWRDRLRLGVLLGCAWHDLGKANDHFQTMIRHTRGGRVQAVRHEAISGLLLLGVGSLRSSIVDVALARDGLATLAALAAVCGHHVKFPPARGFANDESGDARIGVQLDHPDFTATVRIGAVALGVELPSLAGRIDWRCSSLFPGNVFDQLDALLARLIHDLGEVVQGSMDARRFVALVKALTLGSDVAGSALARAGEATHWIKSALGDSLLPGDAARIVTERLGQNTMRPFQAAIAESSARVTLVRAGCGSGKTLGAYAWSERRATGRKLFFAYPTTGTTTEGFRDYVFDIDLPKALIHSRADVDIEDILSNGDESAPLEREHAIDALRAWTPRVVTCTVDTILGAMTMNRAGLFAFPAIVEAAFVFDEIHAYDDRLFGLLLRFLELLAGAPVLLMTASLQPARLAALRSALSNDLAEIGGPRELEDLPRYRFDRVVANAVPWERISEVVGSGGKVLVVCNRVALAMQRAQEAIRQLPETGILTYHSRYRYEDRVARHRRVIDAFAAPRPMVVFATQVAEMSLDLSADLLVTDMAPIPSLIQRLGRLNRRATPAAPGDPAPAVAMAFQGLPYSAADLQQGGVFWAELARRDVLCQSDLAEAFARLAPNGEESFLIRDQLVDGLAVSMPDSTREPSPSITVLLERDAERVRREPGDAVRCALPLVLPARLRRELASWPRVGFLPVVPETALTYDPELGAQFTETRGAAS
jgi:CRISPR-associated endonuclease/helicase Cas3